MIKNYLTYINESGYRTDKIVLNLKFKNMWINNTDSIRDVDELKFKTLRNFLMGNFIKFTSLYCINDKNNIPIHVKEYKIGIVEDIIIEKFTNNLKHKGDFSFLFIILNDDINKYLVSWADTIEVNRIYNNPNIDLDPLGEEGWDD